MCMFIKVDENGLATVREIVDCIKRQIAYYEHRNLHRSVFFQNTYRKKIQRLGLFEMMLANGLGDHKVNPLMFG